MGLTTSQQALARALFTVGAVKFGAFKLKVHETQPDVPLSPIYLNLRDDAHPVKPGPMTAEIMNMILNEYNKLFDDLSVFTCFTGIPNAGEPFADVFEQLLEQHGDSATRLTLTKIDNADGTRRITQEVDGDFEEGDFCLVLDDLITAAGTKLEAITALESNGIRVDQVLVVVNREQGGELQLADKNYELVSIFTLSELLGFYVQEELLDAAKADEVRDYIAANQFA